MKHKAIINPKHRSAALTNYIDNLPKSFEESGEIIYRGRNTVRQVNINGREYIVKKFHTCSLFRGLLNLFRSPKALRAYKYGLEFLKRGVETPEPVAMINIYRAGLVYQSYFISLPDHSPDLTFLRQPGFNTKEARLLAHFLHQVQTMGIMHGDLNLTNILLHDPTSNNPLKRYALIDTNRSRILRAGQQPGRNQRAANLMRVTHRRDLLRYIISSLPISDATPGVRDVFRLLLQWERRKRILHKIFPH